MQLCASMLSSSSRSRPLSFQLESNRVFLLALRSIALLVMPHLMTSKLPSGTPESARSFIGLVKILEKQLTLEDVQQLAVLSKSMKEVTTIWQKLLSDNGNVLPPEWNADEDLRNVQYRCDGRLFSEVGRALATVLTELLQVIDLDIENLTDIVEHLNNMSSTKEKSNNALALEKTRLASCQSQDDIRRQSLDQLQVLRKKRQAVEEEGSNSFRRNDDPLICIDEEKFCADKIRLGVWTSTSCVSHLCVNNGKMKKCENKSVSVFQDGFHVWYKTERL